MSFSERPAKVESTQSVGGERPGRIYNIGRNRVTIYENGDVTTEDKQSYQGDPRRTLPNLEIIDGQIRIVLEDLIDIILARIEPAELATSLWANTEVKEAFMDALVDGWARDNVGDTDRRKFIDKVKSEIHDKALDRLAGVMAKMEYEFSRSFSCMMEIRNANETLRAYEVFRADGDPLRLKEPSEYGEFKIGGESWNQAREHWRDEVSKYLGWEVAE